MRKRYIIDCEVYKNYFLMSAMDMESKEVKHFELSEYHKLDRKGLKALFDDNLTISFNGENFDLPIVVQALRAKTPAPVKALSDAIIKSNLPAWRTARDFDIQVPTSWNHIDLIEVCPGKSSLKIYGARLHQEKLEDLPVEPDAILTRDQMEKIKSYCINDLETTLSLARALEKQIGLRSDMSRQYQVDLRSKSDAQIAETVILSELERMTGKKYRRPDGVEEVFRYRDPKILSFKTEVLKNTFAKVLEIDFTLGGNGSVVMPDWLRQPIELFGVPYQMGIGGLHSMESAQYIKAGDDELLLELDVASYYPNIIMQQRMAPVAIGKPFLDVYQSILERRMVAKRNGNKAASDTLKIAVNGSFGKLGSKYSVFYAPDLLIQVTVTGQLALLMLIERMRLANINVVSANTDGIVLHCKKSQKAELDRIAWDWMLETSYMLEETQYRCIASRNVNNYLAVTASGNIKGKGCFANAGLSKNPDFQIVFDAVKEHVANGTEIEEFVKGCTDIRKFVSVRRVQGGAVWRDQDLGRAVRFYYSVDVPETESIKYKTNSNTVPKSSGAKPLMNLPGTFPDDVNYKPYVDEAYKLLTEVGFVSNQLF